MGKLYLGRQGLHFSRQKIETAQLRRFFAGLVEDLQSQTNAQKRHAAVDGVDERGAHLLLVQSANQSRVVSNAGEQEDVGF